MRGKLKEVMIIDAHEIKQLKKFVQNFCTNFCRIHGSNIWFPRKHKSSKLMQDNKIKNSTEANNH